MLYPRQRAGMPARISAALVRFLHATATRRQSSLRLARHLARDLIEEYEDDELGDSKERPDHVVSFDFVRPTRARYQRSALGGTRKERAVPRAGNDPPRAAERMTSTPLAGL